LYRAFFAAGFLIWYMSGGRAVAFEEITIEGTAIVDNEACAKNGNCSLTFKFGGRTARLIYEGMIAAARANEETGGLDKTDGSGMSCHKENDRHSCSFRYDFGRQDFSLAIIGD
jgi:hypothetical protein